MNNRPTSDFRLSSFSINRHTPLPLHKQSLAKIVISCISTREGGWRGRGLDVIHGREHSRGRQSLVLITATTTSAWPLSLRTRFGKWGTAIYDPRRCCSRGARGPRWKGDACVSRKVLLLCLGTWHVSCCRARRTARVAAGTSVNRRMAYRASSKNAAAPVFMLVLWTLMSSKHLTKNY